MFSYFITKSRFPRPLKDRLQIGSWAQTLTTRTFVTMHKSRVQMNIILR